MGGDSPDFTYVPEDEDVVVVELTSSEQCTQVSSVSSNPVNMIVYPVLPVSKYHSASDNDVCDGAEVMFTATPVHI